MADEFDSKEHGPRGTRARRSAPEPAQTLLPVIQKRSDHPCFRCAKCCQYVAVEIDRPSAMKDYDHILWYLYHAGVSVFVDWNGDWYIKFETRCEHLTSQGLCGIYERRPAICKDFDWRDCEQHVKEEPPDKWLFETADDFQRWFRDQRPRAWRRYQDYMRRKHGTGEEPELERVDDRGGASRARAGRRAP